MENNQESLSLEAFKNSFNYGSRSDMNFKFLKALSTDEAAQFIEGLFKTIIDSIDARKSDDLEKFLFNWQSRGYAGKSRFVYEDSIFTKLKKPLKESRMALLTSSGHFLKDNDPKPFGIENMSQKEAEERIMDFIRSEPFLSKIPINTPDNILRVRHGGYDVRGAQQDPNVNFPLSHLREIHAEGGIGDLSEFAYSFVGACSQIRLQKDIIPEWIKAFKEHKVDAMLLVPV